MSFIKPFDEAVREMSHLRLENLRGRKIPFMPLHDAEGWHVWMSTPDGQVMHMRPVGATELMYFAEKPANERDDFSWALVDFLVQHFDLGRVANRLRALIDHVWCISASMAKIELIHRVDENRTALDWLVATEIEYLVSVCRSMFDLLQEVIIHVWSAITLDGKERPNPKLKQSFADMVLRADNVLSSDEIAERHRIPAFLADYYAACGGFFLELRQYRNRFLHQGDRAERLYVTERGFAVSKTATPFVNWKVWDDESIEENVASLRPVLRFIVGNTIGATNHFAAMIQQNVRFLPPIAPGFTVFFRNAYNGALLRALSPDAKWWDRREPPTADTAAADERTAAPPSSTTK